MQLLRASFWLGIVFWGCSAGLGFSQTVTTTESGSSLTNAPPTLSSEVAKLLTRHADPQVVLTYIEQWQRPYLTSTEDLVHLRQLGASTAILDAYARRGAELRLKAVPSPTNGAPSVLLYPVAQPPSYSPLPDEKPELYLFSERLPMVSEWYGVPYHIPFLWPGAGWWPYRSVPIHH